MSRPSLWELAKRNAVYLYVGLLFVPVGAVFFFIGIDLAQEEFAFANRGHTVEATIADKSLEKADFDKNPSTRYLIHYRFTSPTGTPIDETKAVSVDEWERLAAGDVWRIRVLPGATIETRVTPSSNWPGVVAFLALGLMFILVGIVMLMLFGREIRRRWRLFRAH